MTVAVRHTWFMVGRQLRNLMREPIWIALLLVQPMVWLLLYGQLFKRVTHLPVAASEPRRTSRSSLRRS